MAPVRPPQRSLTAITSRARSSAVVVPPGQTTYAFDVTVNGDVIVEPDEAFAVHVTGVTGALVFDGDAVGTIVNDDEPPPVAAEVVISQVYGGGGNSGATLTHDFIELFNRGTTTVSLEGWSVQYTSAGGTGTWQVTPLTGSIAARHATTSCRRRKERAVPRALPSPDATGTIAMAAGAGKVALQVTATPIVGACPASGTADLVGYGAATCFEGMGPAGGGEQHARPRCASAAAASIPTTTASTSRSATRCRATRRAGVRSCVPVPAAIHDSPGQRLRLAVRGPGRPDHRHRHRHQVERLLPAGADGAADTDPATSEGIFVFTAAAPAVTVGGQVGGARYGRANSSA